MSRNPKLPPTLWNRIDAYEDAAMEHGAQLLRYEEDKATDEGTDKTYKALRRAKNKLARLIEYYLDE